MLTLVNIVATCVSSVLGIGLMTGCSSGVEAGLTERGRNVQACEEVSRLYEQMYIDFDEGRVRDAGLYVEELLSAQIRIGEEAASPMGDWLVENTLIAREKFRDGDIGEIEQRGSDANNGLDVNPDEGSIYERCLNLGVRIP